MPTKRELRMMGMAKAKQQETLSNQASLSGGGGVGGGGNSSSRRDAALSSVEELTSKLTKGAIDQAMDKVSEIREAKAVKAAEAAKAAEAIAAAARRKEEAARRKAEADARKQEDKRKKEREKAQKKAEAARGKAEANAMKREDERQKEIRKAQKKAAEARGLAAEVGGVVSADGLNQVDLTAQAKAGAEKVDRLHQGVLDAFSKTHEGLATLNVGESAPTSPPATPRGNPQEHSPDSVLNGVPSELKNSETSLVFERDINLNQAAVTNSHNDFRPHVSSPEDVKFRNDKAVRNHLERHGNATIVGSHTAQVTQQSNGRKRGR